MRGIWRIVVGALSGVTAAVIWALSTAIYQPFMQPHGFSTTSDGQTFPQVGENNTYWPRDIRQLAILLAFAGIVLIGRASVRGILVGAIVTIGWLGVDLWLDRIDVAGRSTAIWLATIGVAAFSVTAAAAARVSVRQTGTPLARHLVAGVAAVLGFAATWITTPWDEPVTNADDVRIDDALSMMKAGLAVMFIVTAIGLVAAQLTAVRIRQAGLFVALAVLAAWSASAAPGLLGLLSAIIAGTSLTVAMLAIIATREVPLTRLFTTAIACVVALLPAGYIVYFAGWAAGSAMTSLAGNPPINPADTDLSIAFAGLVIGLLLAAVSYVILLPARQRRYLGGDTVSAVGR